MLEVAVCAASSDVYSGEAVKFVALGNLEVLRSLGAVKDEHSHLLFAGLAYLF